MDVIYQGGLWLGFGTHILILHPVEVLYFIQQIMVKDGTPSRTAASPLFARFISEMKRMVISAAIRDLSWGLSTEDHHGKLKHRPLHKIYAASISPIPSMAL